MDLLLASNVVVQDLHEWTRNPGDKKDELEPVSLVGGIGDRSIGSQFR